MNKKIKLFNLLSFSKTKRKKKVRIKKNYLKIKIIISLFYL